jgi:hypothetical protein
VANMITLVVFLVGNVYAYTRISMQGKPKAVGKYNEDKAKLWKLCNCDDFQARYSASTIYYLIGAGTVFVIAFLQLLPSAALWCLKKRPTQLPSP